MACRNRARASGDSGLGKCADRIRRRNIGANACALSVAHGGQREREEESENIHRVKSVLYFPQSTIVNSRIRNQSADSERETVELLRCGLKKSLWDSTPNWWSS